MAAGVSEARVAVFGASSLVGRHLLQLLPQHKYRVVAFSRSARRAPSEYVTWHFPSSSSGDDSLGEVTDCLSVAPIWELPQYFDWFEAHRVRRIVALSSTSRFTKLESPVAADRYVAERLELAETALESWATRRGVRWLILRPTLIYGGGHDKNITEIMRFVRRFGCFPLLGEASGLRQPIHAKDVAEYCVRALLRNAFVDRAYNISGGEILSYREMVQRVFICAGRRPRFLPVPLQLFRLGLAGVRWVPYFHPQVLGMLERMNQHMVFDSGDAIRDFDFVPRPFILTPGDMPK